jgi:hypothetical protein
MFFNGLALGEYSRRLGLCVGPRCTADLVAPAPYAELLAPAPPGASREPERIILDATHGPFVE